MSNSSLSSERYARTFYLSDDEYSILNKALLRSSGSICLGDLINQLASDELQLVRTDKKDKRTVAEIKSDVAAEVLSIRAELNQVCLRLPESESYCIAHAASVRSRLNKLYIRLMP